MSPGAVFHPGHDEWHGQTVVVHTTVGRTVIGRWDSIVGEHVQMMDCAVHEPDSAEESRETWVARLQKFGVPAEHRSFSFPHAEVAEVVRLRDA